MSNLATQEESKNPTTRVLAQIQRLTESNSLIIPADYAVENALKNAWFWILNSEQKDKLLACTPESQVSAIFDMVLQHGDVARKTGYFIPYGSRMIYQRSYFGEEALAKRVRPGIEIYSDVVYKGENFKVGKRRTRYGFITVVTEHDQVFPRESKEIVCAYCGIIDESGESMGDEIMDMEQIKTSWKKSKQYGPNSQTFHNEQPDIACKRTVTRRRCKVIINTSNDRALLESVKRQELDAIDARVDEVASERANQNVITMPVLTVENATALDITTPIAEASPAQEPAPVQTEPQAVKEQAKTASSELFLNQPQMQEVSDRLAVINPDMKLTAFLAKCAEDKLPDYAAVCARLTDMEIEATGAGY